MATRQKPTFDDRVQEYVDSPMMTQRLRHESRGSKAIAAFTGRPLTLMRRT
jgi:hypothetical protein